MTTGKTALILVFTALAGCSATSPSSNNLHPDVTIRLGAQTLGSSAFSPNPLTISLATKQSVRWGNSDYTGGSYGGSGVAHTVTADSGLFSSGQIQPRSAFSFTFTTPGTYTYHCSNHTSMVGSIVVTP
ncbi:MAG: plastocyanin/azurin family copper-binding protein [Gemmatimonadota bacterium]